MRRVMRTSGYIVNCQFVQDIRVKVSKGLGYMV